MSRNPISQFTFSAALGLMLASCVSVTLQRTATTPTTTGGGAGASGPTRPWPAAATCPTPARSPADERQVVALINAERGKAGLGALSLSPALSTVAHAYACELAARGDIGHTGSDGSTLSERLRRGGVAAAMVAENNAAGYRTPAEVVAAWMTSPQHRENILRPNAARVGIGLADGAAPVWVADFTS